MDPITENPELGVPEVWEIYNTTADAHPIHIHEIQFQVVDRQALELDDERHGGAALRAHRQTLADPSHGRPGARTRSPPIPAR